MDDSLLNVNMSDDNTFGIDLTSDNLQIDANSLIQTDILDVSMQNGDILEPQLESQDELEVNLVEGIPVGMDDYEVLKNLPKVNGVELKGDKSFENLGREKITNSQIKQIIDEQYELIFGGGNNG